MFNIKNISIGIVGLGYVGLPVAIALSKKFPVVGFDTNQRRIEELRCGRDWTGEIQREDLVASSIKLSDDTAALAGCNFFVVAVPTPVDADRRPDFSMMRSACRLLGPVLSRGSIVVFESTVYPGATEDICGPELQASSGLRCGTDFKLGYSPERINPGDREHPLEKIVKIVSGQDEDTLAVVEQVYSRIIDAGVFRASSIKVAEAAKVLENTQRDINIALMNEMSKICDRLDIRTSEVLEAAATKWNFLRFYPGLVGGHCIGVDPYYLTSKAEQLGYHPEVILAGRRINDGMPAHVATRFVQALAVANCPLRGAKIGIMGITFKENVPDIRNSKVAELYQELRRYGLEPMVWDPIADADETRHEYGINLSDSAEARGLDGLILAVPHEVVLDEVQRLVTEELVPGGVVFDLKSALPRNQLPAELYYWAL